MEYEIIKSLGTISENDGYTKQINIISWNHNKPKLDIRSWLPSGKPGKGVSLDKSEFAKLKKIINEVTL